MILVADSGSSHCGWALVQGEDVRILSPLAGMNPYYREDEELRSILAGLEIPVADDAIQAIWFYGSGVSGEANHARMRKLLAERFLQAEVHVHHDLMAAAHALSPHAVGIVCIAGTGANAAHYDGQTLRDDQRSLGYLLGDEGSGFWFGRLLLRDHLYGHMPDDLQADFAGRYHVKQEEVLHAMYREPAPNRYIASFAPFLSAHATHPYIRSMVEDGFARFERAFLRGGDNGADLPVHGLGSILAHFESDWRSMLRNAGRQDGLVVADPLPLLARYHSQAT